MIIRCPQCEHSRTINESKIPSTAELATCPKCKHRFRFRTLTPSVSPELTTLAGQSPPPPSRERTKTAPMAGTTGDIWDAVDSLHHRWQTQMDMHVTVVETPKPSPPVGTPPEQKPSEQGAADPPASVPPGAEHFFDKDHEFSSRDAAPSDAVSQKPQSASGLFPGQRSDPTPQSGYTDSAIQATSRALQAASLAIQASSNPLPASGHSKTAEPPAVPPAFPYAQDDTPPEERVDRDMKLLRDSAERPLRDLGKLDDRPAQPTETEETSALDDDIPWEAPSAHGWLRAFTSTIHGVMFNGPAFFSRIHGKGSLAPGYLFFLLLGGIAVLCSVLWARAALKLLNAGPPASQGSVSIPVLLLLAPIALGLVQLFITGGIRFMLHLFAPEQAEFARVFKIVSYSVSPLVLSIVPFVGPVVGTLWVAAALLTGCRNALGLSWQLAIAAPLPPTLCLIGGLVWYFR